jgi:hypothetical protein
MQLRETLTQHACPSAATLRKLARVFAVATAFAGIAPAQQPESYLPLSEGLRWVLSHPSVKKTVSFEVLSRDGDGYRIRFDSPFGSNDWTLVPEGGKILLTRFGKNGQMMDLPENSVYFDFRAPAGTSWKMTAGEMRVLDRSATVGAYSSAIKIRQGKDLVFTFARGVGFVQFGEGKNAFTLDESASRLPGKSTDGGNSPTPSAGVPPTSKQDDSRPVQHVPGSAPSVGVAAKGDGYRRNFPKHSTIRGPLLVGITVNAFANESQSPQTLLNRWQQSIETGVTFVVSNSKWDEVEPKKGNYQLDGLDFQVSEAQKHNLQVAYTLRLIDTVDRTMPSEMKRKKWTDPEMESRVLKLVEAMAPRFKDRVKWFMFGNEIDGYFGRHPEEVPEFAQLFDKVSRRLKEMVPGILVSSTIMYGGIDTLNAQLKPLNDRFDFLAITYYPIRGDFTMKDPSIVRNDFARMKSASEGRGVVLQEIGYASSSVNGSSEEKQAQFIREVFGQLRANRDVFDAGSFFLLADLSDSFVKNLSKFYGVNAKTFSAFLQTTGLYDLNGKPKMSWNVFQSEMQHLR